ncbi:MAG TPA: acetyl-CoA carboxylase biotin carboxylase subunit [candidate division Zixibacteria bacterium]|nr:acetyl-CoA carboxylase biotin carboxylase subunit [candidate division Zixibacteria bacterium]
MLKKVLVANRGEIALRVIRACRELGIATVAVYSTADRYSLPVILADESICIGPPRPFESYLDSRRILSAAIISNADAIHPGYGFLAENAEFAEKCSAHHMKFIGPSPEVIKKMGDKAEAKRTMRDAGIPVIPGSEGLVQTLDEALSIAREIGYPVMVKAAFGGGGKGMRIVREEAQLKGCWDMARAEAESAFGNSGVYIEKCIEKPRHIEVQLLGDGEGGVIHLGERDCSIQRRHQKLVEESPSPALDKSTRARIGKIAAKGAEAINYEGAGTIEFLLDANGNFFFLEMNTRIQVEHPVTESVVDLDLVKEQIRIANGQGLPLSQDDVIIRGHAIECRINAEDSERDFAPSPGKITAFHAPGGPGIRVDTHAYAEGEIPPFYDSMIAKLICRGRDRDEALARMSRALDEFIIEGIATTIPFHKKVMRNLDFIRGEYDTSFIFQLNE